MILCWGSNPEGHFGGEIEGDAHIPIETEPLPFETISAGSRSSFGITGNGILYASGANECGQLGLGSNESTIKFTKVNFEHKVKQISCGWAHSLLLTEDGRVFSSGDGKKGQLGFEYTETNRFEEVKNIPGKVIQVACGVWSSFAVLENGQVFFWGQFRSIKPEICPIPTLLEFPENVHKISVGHKHILTLSSDAQISGHGCNKYGQIALEEYKSSIVKDIFAGWNHSVLWLNTNELVLIGKNDHNQLAHPDKMCHENVLKFENEDIHDVSVGSDHAMVLTSRRLLVWGWNEHGILGQGHINQIYGPPQELKFELNDFNRIKKIICGPVSSFIIKE